MKSTDNLKPVLVFAGTLMQAQMVKSLLENEFIEAYLHDDILGAIYPLHTSPGGFGSTRIVVANKDYELAKIVVKKYEANIN